MLRSDKVITTGGSVLKIMDGSQTFDKVDNPGLWEILGYNTTYPSGTGGVIPSMQDQYMKGRIDIVEQLGFHYGSNNVSLTKDQLPEH